MLYHGNEHRIIRQVRQVSSDPSRCQHLIERHQQLRFEHTWRFSGSLKTTRCAPV